MHGVRVEGEPLPNVPAVLLADPDGSRVPDAPVGFALAVAGGLGPGPHDGPDARLVEAECPQPDGRYEAGLVAVSASDVPVEEDGDARGRVLVGRPNFSATSLVCSRIGTVISRTSRISGRPVTAAPVVRRLRGQAEVLMVTGRREPGTGDGRDLSSADASGACRSDAPIATSGRGRRCRWSR